MLHLSDKGINIPLAVVVFMRRILPLLIHYSWCIGESPAFEGNYRGVISLVLNDANHTIISILSPCSKPFYVCSRYAFGLQLLNMYCHDQLCKLHELVPVLALLPWFMKIDLSMLRNTLLPPVECYYVLAAHRGKEKLLLTGFWLGQNIITSIPGTCAYTEYKHSQGQAFSLPRSY